VRVVAADEQAELDVDVLRWLRLAEAVLADERVATDAELSLLFVDQATIAELNARFLDGEGPTDVLAFPIDDDAIVGRNPDQGGRGPGTPTEPSDVPLVIGDVLVCPAVAARNAEAVGKSLDDELALLVVHGVLHLLGYDHAEPEEAARMQRREQALLERHHQSVGTL
jgi:probable rRNA maturation factor